MDAAVSCGGLSTARGFFMKGESAAAGLVQIWIDPCRWIRQRKGVRTCTCWCNKSCSPRHNVPTPPHLLSILSLPHPPLPLHWSLSQWSPVHVWMPWSPPPVHWLLTQLQSILWCFCDSMCQRNMCSEAERLQPNAMLSKLLGAER